MRSNAETLNGTPIVLPSVEDEAEAAARFYIALREHSLSEESAAQITAAWVRIKMWSLRT